MGSRVMGLLIVAGLCILMVAICNEDALGPIIWMWLGFLAFVFLCSGVTVG